MTLCEIERELANEKAKAHPSEPVIACLEAMRRAGTTDIYGGVRMLENTIPKSISLRTPLGTYTEEGTTPPWWCEL